MTQAADNKKTWIAAGVSAAVLLLLLRRCRKNRKAAQQSAADATRAALRKAVERSLLPVFVQPEGLPAGWGVAPPVFYPPYCAVVPLVLPCEMEEVERSSHLVRTVSVSATAAESASASAAAFVLCSYMGPTSSAITGSAEEQGAALTNLVGRHPALRDFVTGSVAQWKALEPMQPAAPSSAQIHSEASSTADDCVRAAFTHVLEVAEGCVLLGGMNGPYLVVAVLSGFAQAASAEEASKSSKRPSSSAKSTGAAAVAPSAEAVMDMESVVKGVRQATLRVPLPQLEKNGVAALASARLPGGAPFAVHRGFYRVLCVRDGRELELCVPSELSVRSDLVNLSLTSPTFGGPPAKGRSLAGKTSSPTAAGGSAASPAGQETLLTLTLSPAFGDAAEEVSAQVTEDVFAALAERPLEAASTVWAASEAASRYPSAKAVFDQVTARPLAAAAHGRANMVTMVYVQPQFGVLFSVHPRSAVVHEPWMTDLPTLLYYPLGEAASSDSDVDAPPVMSVEYVLELPSTWEALAKDEEELVHNVLFHFTNWEAATVSSSMVEISGIRCVMFHESREGRRCRTYIIPRGSTVLILRWETAEAAWDTYLPIFQQTLDTLHVDATAVTR